MDKKTMNTLKTRLGEEGYQKLIRIDNPELHQFIARYIELCNPGNVFVSTDSRDDIKYIRESAIINGEESRLAIDGHTVHFDSYYDQGRDKEHTDILVPRGVDLGPTIITLDRDGGVKEVHDILKNIKKILRCRKNNTKLTKTIVNDF